MLLTLTLVAVGLIVVALAGYLIAIWVALRDAWRSIAGIADGLEAVGEHAGPLPERLATINDALTELLAGLRAAHGHLGRTARVFRIEGS
jgi:hypothetical protein